MTTADALVKRLVDITNGQQATRMIGQELAATMAPQLQELASLLSSAI